LVKLRAQRLAFVGVQTPLFDMTDNANDRLRIVAALADLFSDRIGAGEKLVRKDLIHHDYLLSAFGIMFVKETSPLEGNSHHLQISGLDPVNQGHVHFAWTRWFWFALNPKGRIVLSLQRRAAGRERSGADAGCRVKLRAHLPQRRADRLRVGIAGRRRETK